MPIRIACIVEGQGESQAVPILIRRIAASCDPGLLVHISHLRVAKSKLLRPRELERAAELAAIRVGGAGGILLLLDSDDDCPAELGPLLLARLRAARADLPSAVVLAHREFESWFLAAAESLRGHKGLPRDLDPPPAPEDVRGAKEWLSHRTATRAYSPAVDQASFTDRFDLEGAKRAPSFHRCYREIMRLLVEARDRQRP